MNLSSAGFSVGGGAFGRFRLELRRDLGVLGLTLPLLALVGHRRQRDLTAALLRRRSGLRRGFLLLRFARGVRGLVALGLLGGRLVDLLRPADLVELGPLVVRPHHLVFPLQRLADAGLVLGEIVALLLRVLCFRIGCVSDPRLSVGESEAGERGAD